MPTPSQDRLRSNLDREEEVVSAHDATDRLRAEASFQNARTVAEAREPREKFYFLVNRAMAKYRTVLGDLEGKRILVVGCGQGSVTPLARCGARVTGIDISNEAIKKLAGAIVREGLSGRADVQVMDAERLNFPKQSFDKIVCTGVLHHLNVENALDSWHSVLRSDGSIVMLEPLAWNPIVALYRWLTPSERTSDEHPLKPHDIQMLRRYFRQVDVQGFVLVSTLVAVLGFLPGAHRFKQFFLRMLEPIDDVLLQLFPVLTYFCWTSVICCSDPVDR